MASSNTSNDDFRYAFGPGDWEDQREQPLDLEGIGKKQISVSATHGKNGRSRSDCGNELKGIEKKDMDCDDQERGGQTMIFPVKLHRLLENVEKDRDAAAVVSWCGHGRAFLVHDKEAFVQRFLPRCDKSKCSGNVLVQPSLIKFDIALDRVTLSLKGRIWGRI